jgi:hypothetical protein
VEKDFQVETFNKGDEKLILGEEVNPAVDDTNETPSVSVKEVKNVDSAERAAKEFLWNKFPKARITFQKVSYGLVGGKEIWNAEGSMKVKTGLMSSEMRSFKVQISSSGEVVAYEF